MTDNDSSAPRSGAFANPYPPADDTKDPDTSRTRSNSSDRGGNGTKWQRTRLTGLWQNKTTEGDTYLRGTVRSPPGDPPIELTVREGDEFTVWINTRAGANERAPQFHLQHSKQIRDDDIQPQTNQPAPATRENPFDNLTASAAPATQAAERYKQPDPARHAGGAYGESRGESPGGTTDTRKPAPAQSTRAAEPDRETPDPASLPGNPVYDKSDQYPEPDDEDEDSIPF